MEKCIIVAIADNNAIGKNNALLWHISEDLKFFKRTTSGSPVIMGRRTYESIGRPLPKRLNIIITRGDAAPDGTILAHSLEEAFEIAENHGSEKCFIIGGGQVYSQALPLVERLIVTHVHTEIEDADTYFPIIDPSEWTIVSRSEMLKDVETGYDFEFIEYIRN
ncbi:MAG: dihydrofolate reductase [Bacteroidales bacterium]|nr:dihydrofolate reductase [Bacteroidales bacterium]